jgi:hypothetical protein
MTGPPAVPFTSCELPTTTDLGRLSLEEAMVFALRINCSASTMDECVQAAIAARKQNPHVQNFLQNYLLEVWSRDAGKSRIALNCHFTTRM